MKPLTLVDAKRGRTLETTLHLPPDGTGPAPLIVFGHGFTGHPRKFTKLLGAWADAGFLVVAPAFPLTNDTNEKPVFDDVLNQPADMRFVLDALLEREDVDSERVGVAGFSLGAVTALAVGFHDRERHPRVRAVACLAGCFWPALGGAYEMGTTPLLVVHGTDDAVVAYAAGEAVYRVAQEPKELVTLEGGLHEQEFEDEQGPHPVVVVRTLAFWRTHLARDPGRRV